jgi:hypothetical protein
VQLGIQRRLQNRGVVVVNFAALPLQRTWVRRGREPIDGLIVDYFE